MADYFISSVMIIIQLTVMAVPQFVKLSPITFVSTARKHINQIVLTMAVISASL